MLQNQRRSRSRAAPATTSSSGRGRARPIHGGDGVDHLHAGGFTSVLYGGAGTDYVEGGGFKSHLYGGDGTGPDGTADLFGLAANAFVMTPATRTSSPGAGSSSPAACSSRGWRPAGPTGRRSPACVGACRSASLDVFGLLGVHPRRRPWRRSATRMAGPATTSSSSCNGRQVRRPGGDRELRTRSVDRRRHRAHRCVPAGAAPRLDGRHAAVHQPRAQGRVRLGISGSRSAGARPRRRRARAHRAGRRPISSSTTTASPSAPAGSAATTACSRATSTPTARSTTSPSCSAMPTRPASPCSRPRFQPRRQDQRGRRGLRHPAGLARPRPGRRHRRGRAEDAGRGRHRGDLARRLDAGQDVDRRQRGAAEATFTRGDGTTDDRRRRAQHQPGGLALSRRHHGIRRGGRAPEPQGVTATSSTSRWR